MLLLSFITDCLVVDQEGKNISPEALFPEGEIEMI